MKSTEEREDEIIRAVEMADVYLSSYKDTLIKTGPELITGKTPSESLAINFKLSSALVEIVQQITTRPHYILAKVWEEVYMVSLSVMQEVMILKKLPVKFPQSQKM